MAASDRTSGRSFGRLSGSSRAKTDQLPKISWHCELHVGCRALWLDLREIGGARQTPRYGGLLPGRAKVCTDLQVALCQQTGNSCKTCSFLVGRW